MFVFFRFLEKNPKKSCTKFFYAVACYQYAYIPHFSFFTRFVTLRTYEFISTCTDSFILFPFQESWKRLKTDEEHYEYKFPLQMRSFTHPFQMNYEHLVLHIPCNY